jgi:hypothetical protein
MFSFIFGLLAMVQTSNAPTVDACEWLPANLDGISVQVCAGEVVGRRDQLGNVQGVDGGAL